MTNAAKLDGTARSGIVMPSKKVLNMAVKSVGLGEKHDDHISFTA